MVVLDFFDSHVFSSSNISQQWLKEPVKHRGENAEEKKE
jgi:hypothetical protein